MLQLIVALIERKRDNLKGLEFASQVDLDRGADLGKRGVDVGDRNRVAERRAGLTTRDRADLGTSGVHGIAAAARAAASSNASATSC